MIEQTPKLRKTVFPSPKKTFSSFFFSPHVEPNSNFLVLLKLKFVFFTSRSFLMLRTRFFEKNAKNMFFCVCLSFCVELVPAKKDQRHHLHRSKVERTGFLIVPMPNTVLPDSSAAPENEINLFCFGKISSWIHFIKNLRQIGQSIPFPISEKRLQFLIYF